MNCLRYVTYGVLYCYRYGTDHRNIICLLELTSNGENGSEKKN